MSPYTPTFRPEDFDRYKAALHDATRGRGVFDATDATKALLQRLGLPMNVGDVATLLRDLTDLGHLRRLPENGGPHRFIWVDEQGS